MSLTRILRQVVVGLLLTSSAFAQTRNRAAQNSDAARSTEAMQACATKYYDIHTDLTQDQTREATVRMTKMAEEYHARTADFSGQITERLPFFLFRNLSDYSAAGGMPGTAGVFDGQKLMAVAGDALDARTWHVVQHEGFHQFAQSVIRGDLPIWVNEGLAEYFGEAIFTGDSFVSGVIPAYRLERVKASIAGGKYKSVERMMTLSHEQWNREMNLENYDQAWSMVQFLAHGDGGKYQKPFGDFMGQLNRGRPWQNAWRDTFGSADGFETLWKKWWTGLKANPTEPLYARAAIATLTSFVARSFAQKQSFDDFDAFAQAGGNKQIKMTDADWLPQSLLTDVLNEVDRRKNDDDRFSLVPTAANSKQQMVVMQRPDGSRVTGKFVLRAGRVQSVKVDSFDHPQATPAGKKAGAKITSDEKSPGGPR